MEIKVSVVIPCYEYGGKGVRYLSDMFRTISQQTLKEVEVIIPDHSVNTDIEEFCHDNIFDLNIIYFRNEENRGDVASNKNLGMDLAKGEIVKMMYMDDYFYTNDALEKTYNTLINSDRCGWYVVLIIREIMVKHLIRSSCPGGMTICYGPEETIP